MVWQRVDAMVPIVTHGIVEYRIISHPKMRGVGVFVGNGTGFHSTMLWATIRIPKTRQLATIPWRSGTVGWEMMRVSAMAGVTIGIPQQRQLPATQWRNDAGFHNVHNVVGNNWDSTKASTPRHTPEK